MTRIPSALIDRANVPVQPTYLSAPRSTGGEYIASGLAAAGGAVADFAIQMEGMRQERIANKITTDALTAMAEAGVAIDQAESPEQMREILAGTMSGIESMVGEANLPDHVRERLQQQVQLKSLEFQTSARRKAYAFEMELYTQQAYELADRYYTGGDFEMGDSVLGELIGRTITADQARAYGKSQRATFGEAQVTAFMDANPGVKPPDEYLDLLHPIRKAQFVSMAHHARLAMVSKANDLEYENEVATMADRVVATGSDYGLGQAESDLTAYVNGLELQRPQDRPLMIRAGVAEIAKRKINSIVYGLQEDLNTDSVASAEASLKELAGHRYSEVSIVAKSTYDNIRAIRKEMASDLDRERLDTSNNRKIEYLERIDKATGLKDLPTAEEVSADSTLTENGEIVTPGLMTAADSYIVKHNLITARHAFLQEQMKFQGINKAYATQNWAMGATHSADAEKHFKQLFESQQLQVNPEAAAAAINKASGGAIKIDESTIASMTTDPESAEAAAMVEYLSRTGVVLPRLKDYLGHRMVNIASEGGGGVDKAAATVEMVYALGGNLSMREQLGPLYEDARELHQLHETYGNWNTPFEIKFSEDKNVKLGPERVREILGRYENVDFEKVTQEVIGEIIDASDDRGFFQMAVDYYLDLPRSMGGMDIFQTKREDLENLKNAYFAEILDRTMPEIERQFAIQAQSRKLDANADPEGLLRSVVNSVFREKAPLFSYMGWGETRIPVPGLPVEFVDDNELTQTVMLQNLDYEANRYRENLDGLVELAAVNPEAAGVVYQMVHANAMREKQGGKGEYYKIEWKGSSTDEMPIAEVLMANSFSYEDAAEKTGIPVEVLKAESQARKTQYPSLVKVDYDELRGDLADEHSKYYNMQFLDFDMPKPSVFVSPAAEQVGLTRERIGAEQDPARKKAMSQAYGMAAREYAMPRYQIVYYDATTGSATRKSYWSAIGGVTNVKTASDPLYIDPTLKPSEIAKTRTELNKFLEENRMIEQVAQEGFE